MHLTVKMSFCLMRLQNNTQSLTGPFKYCSLVKGSCFGGCCSSGPLPSASILTAPLGIGYDVGMHTPPWVVHKMFGAMKSRVHISNGMAVMES